MTDAKRRRDFLKASAALAGAAATGGIGGAHAQGAPVLDKPPRVKPLRQSSGTTIEFTEGVPARVSVAHLLPPGADRYHGGFFNQLPGNISGSDFIPGIGFDPKTKEITYDGSALAKNPKVTNPSTEYFVGYETGPYNAHWQFPPTTIDIPQYVMVNGVATQRAITNGCKHTRPRYCPLDGLVHIFGGDYSTAGLLGPDASPQNGRMLLWHVDPTRADQASAWGLDYPVKGRPGEDQPLSPDIMGFSWDPTRQIWWISYGDVRGGYYSDAAWKADGGLSNAWPPQELVAQPDAPLFVFDPRLGRYRKLAALPWDTNVTKVRESAYDDASRRLYKMEATGRGIRVHYLDTRPYDTNPDALAWASDDVDLGVGSSRNLTGTAIHASIVGCNESPMHVDDQARLLYFVDSRNPAVLALTLPGHPDGEHRVRLVADLPGMVDFSTAPFGLLASASMPFVWIPEHRALVLMAEPLQHMVGPQSSSFTIDVDSGTVSDGPRFPQNVLDGMPWFPGAGVWYPPTQELLLYACYADNYDTSRVWYPQTMHRYKWVA